MDEIVWVIFLVFGLGGGCTAWQKYQNELTARHAIDHGYVQVCEKNQIPEACHWEKRDSTTPEQPKPIVSGML